MGKFIQLIILLIFIDMMFFLFSGDDLMSISFTSMIFLAIKNGSIDFIRDNLFNIFIVASSNLVVGAGVYATAWFTTGSRETATWITIATAFLLNLIADFVIIYNYLAGIHPPLTYYLATITMLPIAIIYVFIVLEWVRGKD